MSGSLTISLDFELMWGVRDRKDKKAYGSNILGGRYAIPRILDLFERYEVSATWATVGFVMCSSFDELVSFCPPKRDLPKYKSENVSNYRYFGEVGRSEKEDPYYFGHSLVQKIRNTPRQEIGTHTLSHFYCLEPGSTIEAFEIDLYYAKLLAESKGINLNSIVFPRNQYTDEHVRVCEAMGIKNTRRNRNSWIHDPHPSRNQSIARKSLRWLDAYSGSLSTIHMKREKKKYLAADRFIRPIPTRLPYLQKAQSNVLKKEMALAAKSKRDYHVWWHPHNFGGQPERSLECLEEFLLFFSKLRDEYGFRSINMSDSFNPTENDRSGFM